MCRQSHGSKTHTIEERNRKKRHTDRKKSCPAPTQQHFPCLIPCALFPSAKTDTFINDDEEENDLYGGGGDIIKKYLPDIVKRKKKSWNIKTIEQTVKQSSL